VQTSVVYASTNALVVGASAGDGAGTVTASSSLTYDLYGDVQTVRQAPRWVTLS
jgi:hypothetical protein